MMEWKEVKVSDYCTAQNGYAFKSNDFVSDGDCNVIKIKELKDGKIIFTDDTAKVVYANRYDRFRVFKNDVLFALTGDPSHKPNPLSWVGRVSKYNYEEASLLNQRVCKIIFSKDIDSDFFYYYFRQDSAFRELAGKAKGSASQANISTNDILDTIITIPSLEYQSRIASILSSLDSKIETNNKINAKLEEMAQALFKSWFVDFEPFKDGEFEESELGRIPKGWRVGSLLDIANLYDSKRKPLSSRQRDERKGIYPYYGATSIMDYVDDYIFDGTYLLMGEDGSVVKEDGTPYLQYVWGKFWSNNHAHVMQGKNGYTTEMLYSLLLQTNVVSIVTGAVQLKISQQGMSKIRTVIPDKKCCVEYDKITQPIFEQLKMLKEQNTRLSHLRDTLLPKLMNGEIEL